MNIKPLNVYGCGSPIRLPIAEAMAQGSGAVNFLPQADPTYVPGNSIVWGLIRGARNIIESTISNHCDYYQMDNAYFGRDVYYRITRNGLQLSKLANRDESRLNLQFKSLNLKFENWKKRRGDNILICASSEDLYRFYQTTADDWISSTISKIRRYTDRPIVIRKKQLFGIEDAVKNSWIVVTHSSAAAIDALRFGIPVIITEESAAMPLATKFSEIENPRITANRRTLFSTLAWGQFTMEEMRNGFAWTVVSKE